jgi:cadmium resistance protein CadD (predicted permease)
MVLINISIVLVLSMLSIAMLSYMQSHSYSSLPQLKYVNEIRSGWLADVPSVLLGLFAAYEHHLFRLLQIVSFGNIK